MTNKEKLATLKDYELAEVIVLLAMHTDCIQHSSGASENLDATDFAEDTAELIINWLNDTYDEEKGFGFYPGELVFLKQQKPCNNSIIWRGRKNQYWKLLANSMMMKKSWKNAYETVV